MRTCHQTCFLFGTSSGQSPWDFHPPCSAPRTRLALPGTGKVCFGLAHGVIFWGCHFLRGRVSLTPRGGSLLPPQPLKPWNLEPGWSRSTKAHPCRLHLIVSCFLPFVAFKKVFFMFHGHFSSVAQSCLTLRPHGLQHAGPPCPSSTSGVHSNSCPSSL